MKAGTLATIASAALCSCFFSPEYSDYCKGEIGCVGGNDKDIAACEDTSEGEEDVAADYGCGSQFDDLATCETSNGSCQTTTDPTTGATIKTWSDQGKCSAQNQALETCEQNASAHKTH